MLTIGISSHNIKQQVPNDIPTTNLFIPPEHLKSQNYLDQIQKWTVNQKMMLNQEKTKYMIFNFGKQQFSTRLSLKGKVLEEVKEIKLLGTYITKDLKWNRNTNHLVKRAYSRMELLRQMTNFTKSTHDKLHIYKVYIRSILEQACVVWHSSLSKRNERELERVQKVAVRLILGESKPYRESLTELKITTLKERRNELSVKFARKCLTSKKTSNIFIKNIRRHKMTLRSKEHFKVKHAKTVRMEKSAVINMTHQLNNHMKKKENMLNK